MSGRPAPGRSRGRGGDGLDCNLLLTPLWTVGPPTRNHRYDLGLKIPVSAVQLRPWALRIQRLPLVSDLRDRRGHVLVASDSTIRTRHGDARLAHPAVLHALAGGTPIRTASGAPGRRGLRPQPDLRLVRAAPTSRTPGRASPRDTGTGGAATVDVASGPGLRRPRSLPGVRRRRALRPRRRVHRNPVGVAMLPVGVRRRHLRLPVRVEDSDCQAAARPARDCPRRPTVRSRDSARRSPTVALPRPQLRHGRRMSLWLRRTGPRLRRSGPSSSAARRTRPATPRAGAARDGPRGRGRVSHGARQLVGRRVIGAVTVVLLAATRRRRSEAGWYAPLSRGPPPTSSSRRSYCLALAAAGALRWRTVRRLGRNDELVEMDVSSHARKQDRPCPSCGPPAPSATTARLPSPGAAHFLARSRDLSGKRDCRPIHERWELELGYDGSRRDARPRGNPAQPKPGRRASGDLGRAHRLQPGPLGNGGRRNERTHVP